MYFLQTFRWHRVAFLISLAPVSLALADQPVVSNCHPPCSFVMDTPVQGQIAVIDPETGDLVSNPEALFGKGEEELEAFNLEFQEQLRETLSVEGLEEQRLEGGAVAVDLGDRFKLPLVLHIDPDGRQHLSHGPIPIK